eukprot:Skav216611  [mRNA]  locus=scaffold2940:69235:70466:+ [translate_table: standard]
MHDRSSSEVSCVACAARRFARVWLYLLRHLRGIRRSTGRDERVQSPGFSEASSLSCDSAWLHGFRARKFAANLPSAQFSLRQFLCNRPISVSYAYKKETKGERRGKPRRFKS